MVTIKDYAEKRNVSYEAVRRQVSKYQSELEGHISKVGRTQYLDGAAEEFLDLHRDKHPVVVMDQEKDGQIEELRSENEALKLQIMKLQDKIIERDDKILEMSNRILALTEAASVPAEPSNPAEKEDKPRKRWMFWRK